MPKNKSPWRWMRPAQYIHRALYAIGFGPILGRIILLLTTTGRKSGKRRVTPLQYEEIEGVLYLGSARGFKADWVRNIACDPHVEVQVKNRHFRGLGELISDPILIADYLQTRLERHPHMVGAMMKMHNLPINPSRVQLEELGKTLAVVAIKPEEKGMDK
jgi:deazaflavin-dependent oxidoreductase (nitroreductase family)